MSENAELTCPKCEGAMRSYERNGIQIEQCRECRGIFLDRGELDRMIDAEAAYAPSAPARSAAPRHQEERGHGDSSHGYGGYGDKKRKKSSFLSELFE